MKLILSIDPGVAGGFAWLEDDGTACCCPMPDTDGDVIAQLRAITAIGVRRCYLEKLVGFIPGAGAGSLFKMGCSYGLLTGALMSLGYEVVLVQPKQWQRALSVGAKKDHGKKWKSHLKSIAQQLYPTCDVTLKTADALLILEYAKRLS